MRGCAVRGLRDGGVSLRVVGVAAVLALAVPASASAQEPAPAEADTARTHTVRKGDTLWDIARTYIGDPFQWPEIYRINRDVVEDPHWIYPGEILQIPGRRALAEAVAPDTTEVPVEPVREAPRETVFSQRSGGIGTTLGLTEAEVPRTTIRTGDYERAPYLDSRGAPHGGGRILGTTELDPGGDPLPRQQYQQFERVLVTPPSGVTPAVGMRLLSVKRGPEIERVGQVVIPTGVLEIVRLAGAGTAIEARVVKSFGRILPEDRLLPHDTTAAVTYARPMPVVAGDGRESQVRWIADEPELPSLQHYVLLPVGAGYNVHLGDEYVLYEPPRSLGEDRPTSQDIEVARVQVVRVTPQGSTAMVIGQERPSIRPGVRARLAARVP